MRLLLLAAVLIGLGLPAHAAWESHASVDPFTDRRDPYAFTGGNKLAVAAKCEDGSMFVIVKTTGFWFSIEDHVSVTYRFDAAEPITGHWLVLKGNKAVLSDPEATSFVRSLANGSQVALRLDNITEVLPLRGSAAALAPAMKACNIAA